MKLLCGWMRRSLRLGESKGFSWRLAIAGVLVGIVLGFGVVGTGASLAAPRSDRASVQTVFPEVPQNRPSLDTSTIPSEKISQFIDAYLQVLNLLDRRQEELRSAETSTESQRIERDIEAEALNTIEKTGLTKQEYLQMLSLANIDPEFGERIAAGLQEAKNQEFLEF